MQNSFNKPLHFHDKGFSLAWEIPEAKWVLVYFKNSQTKPWYKCVKRRYLFKRWFVRKSHDSFSNLANFSFPQVVLYVFNSTLSIPRKVVVPMNVTILRVDEPEVKTSLPIVDFQPNSIYVINSAVPHFEIEQDYVLNYINLNTPEIYGPSVSNNFAADFEIFKNNTIKE